jgi:hypothetical protein
MFEPTRAAALDQLEDFIPRAGREYAASRNYDFGPQKRDNVSLLSPWVRQRLLPEWEILDRVRQSHSASSAGKFIDEVCWHTYWRGWLRHHPEAWHQYEAELASLKDNYATHLGYTRAIEGQSGIDCLDAWTQELVETGYLHNHARMWYASIWTHTLKLPWALGADFFHRHLLDGDPATNTLSWRWVAGVHTRGKSYLARRDNIAKYTDGRFDPAEDLATTPRALEDDYPPMPTASVGPGDPLPDSSQGPDAHRRALLLHEDDLSAVRWLGEICPSSATCGYFPSEGYERHGVSPKVRDFREACLRDTLPADAPVLRTADEVVAWASEQQMDALVWAEPGVGALQSSLEKVSGQLTQADIASHSIRHWWDDHFLPHSKKGFFKLKKAIPGALDQL